MCVCVCVCERGWGRERGREGGRNAWRSRMDERNRNECASCNKKHLTTNVPSPLFLFSPLLFPVFFFFFFFPPFQHTVTPCPLHILSILRTSFFFFLPLFAYPHSPYSVSHQALSAAARASSAPSTALRTSTSAALTLRRTTARCWPPPTPRWRQRSSTPCNCALFGFFFFTNPFPYAWACVPGIACATFCFRVAPWDVKAPLLASSSNKPVCAL